MRTCFGETMAAHRDGAEDKVLLLHASSYIEIGWWDEDDTNWWARHATESPSHPTHWMPLPEPPGLKPREIPTCDKCGSSNLALLADAGGETYRPIVCRDCKAVKKRKRGIIWQG